MTELLKKANQIHNLLLKELKKTSELKVKEAIIKSILDWNWNLHSGIFSCPHLEKELLNLGAQFATTQYLTGSEKNIIKPKTILHIASTLYSTGGHTRMLEEYINRLPQYNHALVLTRQSIDELPNRIAQKITTEIIEIYDLTSHEGFLKKAELLAEIGVKYSQVFLHIHPNDPIPTIAHGIQPFQKIITINHADHLFWVGASITDICINIRPFAENISLNKRGINNNVLLPVPVVNHLYNDEDNKEIRQKLGLFNDEIILLTISYPYKLTPSKTHNFYSTAIKLLSKKPNLIHFIVGVSEENVNTLNLDFPPNLIFLGPLEDPSDYQKVADIYLEGFPFNSLTALLDSINFNCAPVLMYAPANPNCNMESELAFDGILKHPINEVEYLEKVLMLINNINTRKEVVKILKERINYFNGGVYWTNTLNKVLKSEVQTNKKLENQIYFEDNNSIKLNDFDFNNLSTKLIAGNLIEYLIDLKNIPLNLRMKILFKSYPFQFGNYRFLRFLKMLIRNK